MAGVVPKRTTSRRKQWSKNDAQRKQLRSQLASDGCPESQVVLAKQLLEENSGAETDSKENARLGVYWLIKASQQGNLEATDLLKTCLESGRGIYELNYLDAKTCITTSQDEKLARKAARDMFASLSNGGEYITSDQLQKKILIIDKGGDVFVNGELNINDYDESCSDSEEEEWSSRSDQNEKITEDNLIAAAVDYSNGQLPLVSRNLCFDPDLRALEEIPIMQRPILHPILNLRMLYLKLVRYFSQAHFNSQTQLLVALLAYIFFSTTPASFVYIVPILLYFLTFAIMVVTTFRLLQMRRNFNDFRRWSNLFICYSGGNLSPRRAEFQYICNNLKPYGYFFGALLGNLLVYPIISDKWIPQSELTIISFCLTFMTLFGFMEVKRSRIKLDAYVLFSFAINVLAKYPYENDPVVAQGWRFLDVKIPNFTSYVIGNGIEFCINFKIFLYALIPILLVKISARDNWRGTCKTVFPHCVTLSWLQIAIISAQGSTMYGLLRGTLALVGFVLFLPLAGLTSIILPAAAVAKTVYNWNLIYPISLFLFLCMMGFVGLSLLARTRYKKLTTGLQVLCTFLAVFTFIRSLNFASLNVPKQPVVYLPWQIYQRYCNQLVWKDENIAVAQMKCAELQDAQIYWDGYITDIRIKSVENKWRDVFGKLPEFAQPFFYCYYGDKMPDNCANSPEMVRDDCYGFHNAIKSAHKCSLEKYNVYTFEIRVRMNSGIWIKSTEVSLVVDDYFKNFTLAVKPDDHIWFKGSLINAQGVGVDGVIGGSSTYVVLDEIGCLACNNKDLTQIKMHYQSIDMSSIIDALIVGFKFVLNFLLNPVVVFK